MIRQIQADPAIGSKQGTYGGLAIRRPREYKALYEGRRYIPRGYLYVIIVRGATRDRRRGIKKRLASDRNSRARDRRAGAPTYLVSMMNPLVIWARAAGAGELAPLLADLGRRGFEASAHYLPNELVEAGDFAITAKWGRSGKCRALIIRPSQSIVRFVSGQLRELADFPKGRRQIADICRGMHVILRDFAAFYFLANRQTEFRKLSELTIEVGTRMYMRVFGISSREARRRFVTPVVRGRRGAPVVRYKAGRRWRGIFSPYLCSYGSEKWAWCRDRINRKRSHRATKSAASGAIVASKGGECAAGLDIVSGGAGASQGDVEVLQPCPAPSPCQLQATGGSAA